MDASGGIYFHDPQVNFKHAQVTPPVGHIPFGCDELGSAFAASFANGVATVTRVSRGETVVIQAALVETLVSVHGGLNPPVSRTWLESAASRHHRRWKQQCVARDGERSAIRFPGSQCLPERHSHHLPVGCWSPRTPGISEYRKARNLLDAGRSGALRARCREPPNESGGCWAHCDCGHRLQWNHRAQHIRQRGRNACHAELEANSDAAPHGNCDCLHRGAVGRCSDCERARRQGGGTLRNAFQVLTAVEPGFFGYVVAAEKRWTRDGGGWAGGDLGGGKAWQSNLRRQRPRAGVLRLGRGRRRWISGGCRSRFDCQLGGGFHGGGLRSRPVGHRAWWKPPRRPAPASASAPPTSSPQDGEAGQRADGHRPRDEGSYRQAVARPEDQTNA